MKFFIPLAENEEEAERVLSSISKFTEIPIPSPRIFSIQYEHNSIHMEATVGELLNPYYRVKEPVIAILRNDRLYAICTPSRGVARGEPVLVGSHQVFQTLPFET